MATFDYTKTAATALRLLERFGAGVTLRRTMTGEYDPALGTALITTADYLGTAARFDYEQRHIDGTAIQQGDQQVYLAVQQTSGQPMPEPLVGDHVLIGSSAWTVVRAEAISPAGVPVLYVAQVRQ